MSTDGPLYTLIRVWQGTMAALACPLLCTGTCTHWPSLTVDHPRGWVGRHGVLAVVDDDVRLALLEIPHFGPCGTAVVLR
jgi:hypothetical protein